MDRGTAFPGKSTVAGRSATRSRFFLYMALAFLAIAVTGFSTTFFLPLARGTFAAPPVVHVHGILLFSWIVFLIAQASLIQSRSVRVHRRLGWAGALLCAAIVVSGVMVGLFATHRDLAAGVGDLALGNFVNIVIEMILFGALVVAAVVLRRDSESHKRLLLLATISVLGPAWVRFRHFMPFIDNPFVVFSFVADSVLLVAIARDLVVLKRVHPVYLWAGGAMVMVHVIELAAIESAAWLRIARWLLGDAAA